jgi:cell division protein ZapD
VLIVNSGTESVVFEQPLTERIRTFLRLEFLFSQYRHHCADPSGMGLRASLDTLLDILSVLSRSDLRNDLVKDLTDRHARLTKLTTLPDVDKTRLHKVLEEIVAAADGMQQLAPQFAATLLRSNDFLNTVLNRYSIPGGTCAFDLPSYHYWLSQPSEQSRRDLDTWFADIAPFERAVTLYVRLLRSSVAPEAQVALGGMYLHAPQSSCTLLRVSVPQSAGVYPEISAGRHRFTVRFMSFGDVNARSQQASGDIPFELQCCAL